MVLHRWGVETNAWEIGHGKEIRVLTFRASVLRQSESGFALMKGERRKRQHTDLFTVANLPLVINSFSYQHC